MSRSGFKCLRATVLLRHVSMHIQLILTRISYPTVWKYYLERDWILRRTKSQTHHKIARKQPEENDRGLGVHLNRKEITKKWGIEAHFMQRVRWQSAIVEDRWEKTQSNCTILAEAQRRDRERLSYSVTLLLTILSPIVFNLSSVVVITSSLGLEICLKTTFKGLCLVSKSAAFLLGLTLDDWSRGWSKPRLRGYC